MTEDKKIIVDTNILIYLSNDVPKGTVKAVKKIKELRSGKFKLFTSEQVIREFIVTQSNLQKIQGEINFPKLLSDIQYIFKNFIIPYPTQISLSKLITYVSTYQITGKRIHDANIIAGASANNISSIFTNNFSDFSFALNGGFEMR